MFNMETKHKVKPHRKSAGVKMLEAIANDEAAKKFPTIPKEWLAPRLYSDKTANGLTKCIIDFIRLKDGHAERISNTGRIIDNRKTFEDVIGRSRTIGQTKWIPGTGKNGTADISATIAGKSVKVEVKHGSDRQSKVQKQYQKEVEQAGGIYMIARSFEQFHQWYNQTFSDNGNQKG